MRVIRPACGSSRRGEAVGALWGGLITAGLLLAD